MTREATNRTMGEVTGELSAPMRGHGSVGIATSFSRVLFADSTGSFANVAPLPSNVEAIEAALQFVAGRTLLAALIGPSGTGKTHILRTVASVGERTLGAPVAVRSTEEFLTSRRAAAEPEILMLDDAQVALGRSRLRQDLRRVLESRQRRGKPTMIALNTELGPETPSLRTVHALLPVPRSWSVAHLRAPAREERAPLLNHIAGAEGVFLSPALAAILARELGGNGHALVGAMRCLRLESDDWQAPSQAIRALGILDPFFNDNSSWDLRHTVSRAAERWHGRFPGFRPVELACWVMLHEARLCERAVAHYLGRSPAEVYGLATRFDLLLQSSEEDRARVRAFISALVEDLLHSRAG